MKSASLKFFASLLFASALFLAVPSGLRAQEHAGEAHEAAAEGAKEQKEPDPLFKWINFGILAVALGYALAKSLPKDFAARTIAIQKDIKEAKKVKDDAEARAAQVEARLKSLGADIETFRTEAATHMRNEGDRIRQETTAQIARVETQSMQEIESAGKAARRELKQYSSELALNLAEQSVRARLDANTEAALIDDFVADLSRQGSKN